VQAIEVEENAVGFEIRRKANKPAIDGGELVGFIVETVPWQHHIRVGE
jgi:hypothetical protein